jgi:hypothetical protein
MPEKSHIASAWKTEQDRLLHDPVTIQMKFGWFGCFYLNFLRSLQNRYSQLICVLNYSTIFFWIELVDTWRRLGVPFFCWNTFQPFLTYWFLFSAFYLAYKLMGALKYLLKIQTFHEIAWAVFCGFKLRKQRAHLYSKGHSLISESTTFALIVSCFFVLLIYFYNHNACQALEACWNTWRIMSTGNMGCAVFFFSRMVTTHRCIDALFWNRFTPLITDAFAEKATAFIFESRDSGLPWMSIFHRFSLNLRLI